MGWQGVLTKGLATSKETGDKLDTDKDTNLVPGGERVVAKVLNKECEMSMECVKDSERVKGVGTAPPSQLLKGDTVHNLGVGTTRQEMQNV